MRRKKLYSLCAILLAVTLLLSLGVGYILAKYTITWERGFGLHIYPKTADGLSGMPIYFKSNLLKPVGEAAQYDVAGNQSWFSLANALDSHTYSRDKIQYTLEYQVYDEGTGAWLDVPSMTATAYLEGNQYSVEHHEVTPITQSGITYDTVKVTARCKTGEPVVLEAAFRFAYSPIDVSYHYAAGVIYMTVNTNELHGNFQFTWKEGILPDTSDPNLVLNHANPSDLALTYPLNAHTIYEFCFFITDADLLTLIESNPETQMPLAVSIEKAAD